MNRSIAWPRHAAILLALATLGGCAASPTVRQSAEFTNTQLGVLRGQVQGHFDAAAASLERQKSILRDQFGTNARLHGATSEIVGIASAGDSATTKLYKSLRGAATALEASEQAVQKARREYDAELAAIALDEASVTASFGAAMTPLTVLATEEQSRAQLKFLAAYFKEVAEQVKSLRDAESQAEAAGAGDGGS